MASTPPAAEERSRRGRPRSEKARRAILDATSELLTEGLEAISMDAIAARAGVSKATIYRWWPSKELVALDAVFEQWDSVGPGDRDTGSLRGDLGALIRPWVRLLVRKPFGRVIATFVSKAQTDPEFAETYRTRFVEPRRQRARVIFARAIEREEIPADTDVELALDLLYGPFYHRLLHGHAPLSVGFVEDVVDHVVASLKNLGAEQNQGQ